MKVRDAFFVAAILVLLFLLIRSCERRESLTEDVSGLEEEITTTRDSLNRQLSERRTISGNKALAVAQMKASQDSSLRKLSRMLERTQKKLIEATVLLNETRDTGTTSSLVESRDTVRKKDTVYLYPSYSTRWDGKWTGGEIVATRDSIMRDITLYNEYRIKTTERSSGIFSRPETTFSIKNMNPNTRTTDMRTYTVSCKCPKWRYGLVGVGVGLGISFALR